MSRVLAVFDFDGTLIPEPSSELRFVVFLLRRRRLGAAALLRAAGFALYWLPRFGRQVLKKNKAYLAGMTVDAAEALGREFAREVLLPLLRPAMLARLREHQALGDDTALLTGAPSFIAQPVCEALAIRHCVASLCETAHGRFLARPPWQHPFGREKLDLTRRLCAEHGYTLRQVAAYADSIHDRDLLTAAGISTVVDPDAPLRRLAADQGWAVLQN